MALRQLPSTSPPTSNPNKRRRLVKEDDDLTDSSLFLPTPETRNLVQIAVAGEEMVRLVDEQVTAIGVMMSGENVFLTGCAGSGKSVVLKMAIEQLRGAGKRIRIAAPTGKAACNIGGTTLHNLFGLTPKKMQLSMDQLESTMEQSEQLRKRLEDIDVLVIDEISMVENIFFSRLNRLMQAAKDNDQPFGGVQLIVCGDFCQLSPVKPFSYCFTCGKHTKQERSRERKVNIYRCSHCNRTEDEPQQWAFCSTAWEYANFINFNLTTNHRQSEEAFLAILAKLAGGRPLNQTERHLLYNHPCEVENAIHLYSTNAEVDAMNTAEYDKLAAEPVEYRCVDHFRWNPRDDQYRNFGATSSDGRTLEALFEHQYRPVLRLKWGQPVVLTTNLDVEGELVNGSQGKVVGFRSYDDAVFPRPGGGVDHNQLEAGILPSEAESRHIHQRGGESAAYRQDRVKEFLTTRNAYKEIPLVEFHNGKTICVFPDCGLVQLGDEKPYSLLSRTQIPLIAGWAMSVHKSQGMTLDKVVVNTSKMFCAGQAYVALSRARTLRGLKVVGAEKGLDVAGANKEVSEFLKGIKWFE